MLPLVSFFALLPLALALRVPTALDATVTIPDVKVDLTHGLALGTDASAVAAGGTTPFSKRQLNLVPAIQAGTSFCVTLSADLEVDDDGVDVTLDAGTCLCFDAQVEALGTSGPLTVVASTGETFTGDVAAKLRLSLLRALNPGNLTQYLLDILNGLIFDLDLNVNTGLCLQVDLFVANTVRDFSQVGNCCARRCADGFVPDVAGDCVACPPANLCNGVCLTGPALLCNGLCYLASQYTCPSGVPVPNPIPRRRNAQNVCQGFGKEMCAVSGSTGYECINIMNDLESCGGCILNEFGKEPGTDCTAIPKVDEVMCNHGSCMVLSCERGFEPSQNGTACIDLKTKSGSKTGSKLDMVLGAGSKMIAAIDATLF